jgi:hypothetical protein
MIGRTISHCVPNALRQTLAVTEGKVATGRRIT